MRPFKMWMKGYLLVKLNGTQPERFINICLTKGIHLSQIQYHNTFYSCNMLLNDYMNIKDIAKKCSIFPVVRKRIGLPFFIEASIKRWYLYAAAVFVFALYLWISAHIWNIEINGNYKHTDEQLIDFLATLNVGIGTATDEINCSMIESEYRQQYKDISWISVELKDTNLYVEVKETETPVIWQADSSYQYSDIIAVSDGEIKSITTRSGTPLVSAGDIVSKGDILISGCIEIMGDDMSVALRYPVASDGDIIMRTDIPYKDRQKKQQKIKRYTGMSTKGTSIYFRDTKLFSYNSSNPYVLCDIITTVNNLCIKKDFYLPFSYEITSFLEYKYATIDYSAEALTKILYDRLNIYVEDLYTMGYHIIDSKLEFNHTDKSSTLAGVITVEAPLWEYSEILIEDWRNTKQNEHNGNND